MRHSIHQTGMNSSESQHTSDDEISLDENYHNNLHTVTFKCIQAKLFYVMCLKFYGKEEMLI